MAFFHDHILSFILFTPAVGLITLMFVPGENKQAIRWWGNIAMFTALPPVIRAVRIDPAETLRVE
jgi:hypothetical protein